MSDSAHTDTNQHAPAAPSYQAAHQALNAVTQYLESSDAYSLSHSEIERQLEKRGREVLRLLLRDHLRARGPGYVLAGQVRDAEGVTHTHRRMQARTLVTSFGKVKIERAGYGGRGIESLHPFDAELNLPPGIFSHEVSRKVAEEATKSSFSETIETIRRNIGASIGKRQAEEIVQRSAVDFDAFYTQREIAALADQSAGSVLVLSFDAKGVVMRHEDLREGTRKAAEKAKKKLKKRLSRGEKSNRKRMAEVAAVYTIEPHVRTAEDIVSPKPDTQREHAPEPKPQNKRVWASVEKEPEEVIEEAFSEAQRRDPNHTKTWVALVDGNKPQLRLLRKMARRYGVNLTIVLDIIHVIEYLWKAATVFNKEATPEAEAWVSQRLLSILHGRSGQVAGGIGRSATRRKIPDKERKAADACIKYLVNNSSYLDYDKYLVAGLPIATGIIEGACRHLVKQRMDRSGARWSVGGAEAVLRLRALRSSGDFDTYWLFHEAQELHRNHASKYENALPPPIVHHNISPEAHGHE
jgi:hypothetical protein